MKNKLKHIAETYLPEIKKAVNDAPVLKLFVKKLRKSCRYEFQHNGVRQKIPKSAGVYLAYYKKQSVPIYIGETGDLQRLRFHVSKAGQKESTLKKKFEKEFPSQKINSEFFQNFCVFKFVEIPFGRIEAESYLKRF